MFSGKAILIFLGYDNVILSGIDMGGVGKVIARSSKAIVVKWPAGTHWAGNGMPREYHSPETEVMTIEEEQVDKGALKVDRLIAWENNRKGK